MDTGNKFLLPNKGWFGKSIYFLLLFLFCLPWANITVGLFQITGTPFLGALSFESYNNLIQLLMLGGMIFSILTYFDIVKIQDKIFYKIKYSCYIIGINFISLIIFILGLVSVIAIKSLSVTFSDPVFDMKISLLKIDLTFVPYIFLFFSLISILDGFIQFYFTKDKSIFEDKDEFKKSDSNRYNKSGENKICPECKAMNPVEADYCKDCGTKLSYSKKCYDDKTIPIIDKQIIIGRSSKCDVVINDAKNIVSREHLKMYRQGNDIFIENLKSDNNGTYVNGKRIASAQRIVQSDVILLANKYRLNLNDKKISSLFN